MKIPSSPQPSSENSLKPLCGPIFNIVISISVGTKLWNKLTLENYVTRLSWIHHCSSCRNGSTSVHLCTQQRLDVRGSPYGGYSDDRTYDHHSENIVSRFLYGPCVTFRGCNEEPSFLDVLRMWHRTVWVTNEGDRWLLPVLSNMPIAGRRHLPLSVRIIRATKNRTVFIRFVNPHTARKIPLRTTLLYDPLICTLSEIPTAGEVLRNEN